MEFKKGNPILQDFYFVKVDSKRDNVFSTICEFVDGYWDLKNIEHNKSDLTEDSEVLFWLDESEVKECNGNCGMNYCDENGCIDRKRNLVPSDLLPQVSA